MATDSESLLRPQHLLPKRNGTAGNGHGRALVFDFDGTLVDSYPLIEEAFAHVMRTHRLDEAARQLFRESRGLPLPEQDAFLAAHPDLYERSHGAVRLRITAGELALGSLACPGFASGAMPDWSRMRVA